MQKFQIFYHELRVSFFHVNFPNLMSCATYCRHSRSSKTEILLVFRPFLDLILIPILFQYGRLSHACSFFCGRKHATTISHGTLICGLSLTNFMMLSTLSEYLNDFGFPIHLSMFSIFSLFKTFFSVLSQSSEYVFQILQTKTSSGTFCLMRLTQGLALRNANLVSVL